MSEVESQAVGASQHHEQMLKLVTKGFYKELIAYGVEPKEVLTVAAHLLDNIMQNDSPVQPGVDNYSTLFHVKDVQDDWITQRRLAFGQVSLRPFQASMAPLVASWLRDPGVPGQFHPPFPESQAELRAYFEHPQRQYFAILHGPQTVGLVGAESIDPVLRKLEMRKLVGEPSLRGMGIGKRATFLFLYYVFTILRFNKVFICSLDVNIRNLNLNRKFGFELEGVLWSEAVVESQARDVLRMALRVSTWRALFS